MSVPSCEHVDVELSCRSVEDSHFFDADPDRVSSLLRKPDAFLVIV